MSIISGTVKNIIFRNEENGYTVFKLDKISCVGYFENIKKGETLSVEGDYANHPIYGRQFQVLATCVPETSSLGDIENYLSSGEFKGIGEVTAKAIVKEFGKKTFEVIEKEPLKLLTIKRMSEEKALLLSETVLAKKREREAFVFLQRYGVSLQTSRKIYNKYKNKLYDVITKNPYQIIYDIKGIGFVTADNIAGKVGIKKDSIERVKAGILYCLEQNSSTHGNTYMTKDGVIESVSVLLGVKEKLVDAACEELESEKKIVLYVHGERVCVYLRELDVCEQIVAKKLIDIDSVEFQYDEDVYRNFIKKLEKENGFSYDALQKEAVMLAIKHGLLIIIGGAGVGKTTTINLLIKYFENQKMDVMLCAPTGRASKRMTDATEREAKTIHRLLEVQSLANEQLSTDFGHFAINENNPLCADVVIVDEMSMVDIYLFLALVKGIKKGTKLILVGDKDQLPSVRAGQVLRDIVESGRFPVVRLERTFRQNEDSDILINANMINNGIMPDLRKESADFTFLEKNNNNDAIFSIIQQIKRHAKELRIKPLDVMVLTPLRRGGCGTEELNVRLQSYFNPQDGRKAELYLNNEIYREGDKVTHLHNSYTMQTYKNVGGNGVLSLKADNIGVFNGEIGFIVSIDKKKEHILVEYDGFYVVYKFGELNLIEHAFAQTIHKAQGCEADAVVFAIMTDNMLLSKNLIYTAVTRAKKRASIIGKSAILNSVIAKNRVVNRNTGLSDKISASLVC